LKILSLLLALFALPLAAATISGTVTPGAMTVAAYDASGALAATTVAAGDGRYTLTVNPGLYRVLAYDPAGVYATAFYANAESFETSAVLDVRSATASINMTLVRAGFIAGRVSSSSGLRENITVAVYNLSGTLRGSTRTNAAGEYRLVVPPGTYKLVAYDDNGLFATSFYAGQPTFGTATPLAVAVASTTTADFALVRSALLLGIVRDAVTHLDLPNIRVTAYHAATGERFAATTTDGMGRYVLSLAPGSYRLVFDDAAAGRYASVFWPDAESFDRSPVLNVVSGQTATANAALQKGARLSGVVRDAATGVALANVTVAAFNSSGTTRTEGTTDANGRYSLLVPPGTYRVGAFDRALLYAAMFYPQQPLFGAATQLSVVAEQTVNGLDLSLPAAGRVSGAVRDAASGAPAAGIAVGLFDASGALVASAATREDGSFRLAAATGSYRLIAFDPALRYLSRDYGTVVLTAAQELAVTHLTVVQGATVRGAIRDASTGAAVGGVTVSAFNLAGVEIASASTDAAGRFAFAVPAGTYRFAAADPLRRYVTLFYDRAASFETATSVALTAGQAVTIEMSLATRTGTPRRRSVRSR